MTYVIKQKDGSKWKLTPLLRWIVREVETDMTESPWKERVLQQYIYPWSNFPEGEIEGKWVDVETENIGK